MNKNKSKDTTKLSKTEKKVETNKILPTKKHIPFNNLREDKVEESLPQKEVLANAKHTEGEFVKIYGEVFDSLEES
ncbi:MAG: Asp-tRNA(Asn)/Glu-tRNA(Gln) amidotransferase subunit GatC [Candidatus Dojkabacteria bacterium]